MIPFKIRDYKKSDWSSVLQMLVETMEYHIAIQNPIRFEKYTIALLRNFLMGLVQKHRLKKARLLVVQVGNELVGFIYGKIDSQDKELQKNAVKSGTIEELFVKEKFRRQGVAKELILAMEKYFEKNKCKLVRLKDVHAPNELAIKFYKKQGYQPRVVEYAKRLDLK